MDETAWSILLIFLFAAGTLFFTVSAIALRTYSHVKLYEAFKSRGRETFAKELVANTERLILSCGFYRLVTNLCLVIALIWFLTLRRQGPPVTADFVATFIIGVAIFSLFSLAIPHAWAKYAGENVLARTYKFLLLMAAVAAPVLYLFRLYDGFIRRLTGVAETNYRQWQEEKAEEFLNDVEQRRMEGVVDAEEQKMIESVLELSDTDVGKIMTPRTEVIALSVDADLQTVLETISAAGHSRIPVYEGNIDNIVGLIYAKDLLTQIGRNPTEFNVRPNLRTAYLVPETKSLRALLHEFQNQKLHIAVVVDEYGGTAGIVTIEDILEELVGEITDEYEEPQPEPMERIDENTIVVDARMVVDDLNRELDLDLPEDEDYDTVGGFLTSHLGYIPKTGETFEHQNLKFIVVAAEPRRIKRIRIEKTPVPLDSESRPNAQQGPGNLHKGD